MDTLNEWRQALEKILQYYADLPYRYGKVQTCLIISQDKNHYMLMQEGWENDRRIHGCLVHVQIKDNKLWIHYDGIEDGITQELLDLGVPKDCIVLAFYPPADRELTGYAVA